MTTSALVHPGVRPDGRQEGAGSPGGPNAVPRQPGRQAAGRPAPDLLERPLERRMVAAMRLVLASAGLAIVGLDPAEPDRFVAGTYATLAAYTLYSLALYVLASRRTAGEEPFAGWHHWLDVAWYTLLVALSSGTNSVFFFGYLFAALVASLRFGKPAGVRVAVISAVLFALVGATVRRAGSPFELNRFLLRPTFLVVLGYMMASFGGFEITLRRRLALLKEVSAISNPRFGVDRTIAQLMDRIRRFYDAEVCVLLAQEGPDGGVTIRRCDRRAPDAAARAAVAPPPLAERLLAPAPGLDLLFARGHLPWLRGGRRLARDATTGRAEAVDAAACEAILSMLDVASFASVPVRQHGEPPGRLYVGSRRAFSEWDLDFLEHLFRQVTPVIDNVRLVDRLASDAADTERQRIARDIHDSIIQSFVGIHLGLEGLRQKAAADPALAGDVGRLQALVGHEMADARRYVSGLKGSGRPVHALAAALDRFVSKFAFATGIDVRLDVAPGLALNDRLAAEALRIVEEGLSNIRRHTVSGEAAVTLVERDGHLVIRVENPGPGTAGRPPAFTPRSIAERAAALGGRTFVEGREDGSTSVEVHIPL